MNSGPSASSTASAMLESAIRNIMYTHSSPISTHTTAPAT